MITRRRALKGLGALAAVGCTAPPARDLRRLGPEGALYGDDPSLAHRVWREGAGGPASETRRTTVLVVGAGAAGLSAVWRLRAAGVDDIEVLELADTPGGTARSGENAVSAYPWGAHYLPVPNPESTLVLRLCEEMGLVTGHTTDGHPVFDARHLVFAPEDRVFFRGGWYHGIYLRAGASAEDTRQLADFEAFTGDLRSARGGDGRLAQTIPAADSSRDPELVALDSVTMQAFMDRRGWTSERLRWVVDYACRDDYGAGSDRVSAWAALHYFAGRRPWRTDETAGTQYFSWPEGNARIIRHLAQYVPRMRTGWLVTELSGDGAATAVEAATGRVVRYEADQIVLATPSHVTHHLTRGARHRFADHAPWVVANLTLRSRPPSAEPCWNNVLYESPSVGYVEATHQRFGSDTPTVWSWYRPHPVEHRPTLLRAGWRMLSSLALRDLRRAYGDLRPRLDRIDVWRWGHGTIIPAPGVVLGDARRRAAEPMGRVKLAHTDLSGLPLFEEAQYRGVLAAERILDDLGVRTPSWLG